MKLLSKFQSWITMAAVVVALLPVSAFAFPPAPSHLIFGMVRDPYGNPLTAGLVLLQTPSGTKLSASITPNIAPGVNYQVDVPMDSGISADLYQASALKTAASFKLYVVTGNVTNTPIQMLGGYVQLGNPSKQTHIDLFLGQDANGDGIADEWEYALLAALGLNPDLSLLGSDSDQDGMSNVGEFIAGTYPFDPTDSLKLKLMALNGNAPVIAFQAISGRTYTVLGSNDLKAWTPLSCTVPEVDGAGSAPRSTVYVSGVQMLQVQVLQPAGGPEFHFFKLMVQ